MRQRIINILFWSVISAAFIGPGTITTAASAGAGFGYTLIWALVFSTFACIILQEAAARLSVASGQNLGEAIRSRFNTSIPGKMLIWLVLFSILTGCAAYEAGNILGAVAGMTLIFDINIAFLALLTGIVAAVLLWFGSIQTVARVLGFIVAVMGLCFLTTAVMIDLEWETLLTGGILPKIPSGSELLVIGLIGTTVVPYNLFLGSGLKHSQNLLEMRWSLAIAIILGGLISISVLIVGGSLPGNFSFESLAVRLEQGLGNQADLLFGAGLFAAGLSSALTAPLAASITARSIFQNTESGDPGWNEKGSKYRSVWGAVLGTGILFGAIQVQPAPAIILAQALNGIILPVVAIVLLLMVNDAKLLSPETINSNYYNIFMGIVVLATLLLGLTNVAKALTRLLGAFTVSEEVILITSLVISFLIGWPIIKTIKKYRQE